MGSSWACYRMEGWRRIIMARSFVDHNNSNELFWQLIFLILHTSKVLRYILKGSPISGNGNRVQLEV